MERGEEKNEGGRGPLQAWPVTPGPSQEGSGHRPVPARCRPLATERKNKKGPVMPSGWIVSLDVTFMLECLGVNLWE